MKIGRLITTFLTFGYTFALPLSAQQVNYKLINGDEVSGELLPSEGGDGWIILMNPLLGKLKIKESFIFNDNKASKISGNYQVGLNGANAGDSRSFGYAFDSLVKYQGEKTNFSVNASYYQEELSEKDSIMNRSRQGSLEFRTDRSIANSLSIYSSATYDYNQQYLAGVNNTTASLGLGYYLFDNDSSSLRVSLGPTFQWIEGGSECSVRSNCGDTFYANSFEALLNWSISDKLSFILNDKLTATHSSEFAIGNKLSTALRFYPSKESKFYTSLKFETTYQELSQPKSDNKYKLQIGKEF